MVRMASKTSWGGQRKNMGILGIAEEEELL